MQHVAVCAGCQFKFHKVRAATLYSAVALFINVVTQIQAAGAVYQLVVGGSVYDFCYNNLPLIGLRHFGCHRCQVAGSTCIAQQLVIDGAIVVKADVVPMFICSVFRREGGHDGGCRQTEGGEQEGEQGAEAREDMGMTFHGRFV